MEIVTGSTHVSYTMILSKLLIKHLDWIHFVFFFFLLNTQFLINDNTISSTLTTPVGY